MAPVIEGGRHRLRPVLMTALATKREAERLKKAAVPAPVTSDEPQPAGV